MDDLDFMREALSLARKAAERGEVPVGCVIGDGQVRSGPRGNSGHRPGMPYAWRLAAVGVHPVCHPGALRHVRRGHSERPDSQGGLRSQ